MKILILADANSAHTIKWVNSLHNKGIDIYLYTFSTFLRSNYEKGIQIDSLESDEKTSNLDVGNIKKIKYLRALPKVKTIIKRFKPDILHAHYLSSYGLIGVLTGFHPLLISAWGIDIIGFPQKSILHRFLCKFICKKADEIMITSDYMKLWLEKLTSKSSITIPFGIDTNIFSPRKTISLFSGENIIIGTIKSLREQYGIEYLIRAFSIVKNKFPHISLKLLIVGSGTLKKNLVELAKALNVHEDTLFSGYISHNEVNKYHNNIDIFVAVSIMNEETFGVSVLEASACEKPVIVSNIGGLTEIVQHFETGIIVPARDPVKTAEALEKLILNADLRNNLGKTGRKRVIELYEWKSCLDKMINVYKNTVSNRVGM